MVATDVVCGLDVVVRIDSVVVIGSIVDVKTEVVRAAVDEVAASVVVDTLVVVET